MRHPDVSDFDLRRLPPDFYDNPFPYYAALQLDSPVKRLPDGAYLLTRYEDVEFVYKNPKIFSSDKQKEFGDKFGATPLFEHHTTSLVFNDPPLHTRVRRLINGPIKLAGLSASIYLHIKHLPKIGPILIGCVTNRVDTRPESSQISVVTREWRQAWG